MEMCQAIQGEQIKNRGRIPGNCNCTNRDYEHPIAARRTICNYRSSSSAFALTFFLLYGCNHCSSLTVAKAPAWSSSATSKPERVITLIGARCIVATAGSFSIEPAKLITGCPRFPSSKAAENAGDG
ncbi:hypothetical protein PIB30_024905 [Stylosanthes scabra]|uniref:Uncharacterized protein n=1 Tax=Stylosanthes scabra TaxID=79078 RepID=A0ABU6S9M9_9FABA|nr:hypothetical protein [Stylosanthes scabra]